MSEYTGLSCLWGDIVAKSFTASVAQFSNLTKQNLRYVAVNSIQDVVEAAQTPQPSVKRTSGAFEVGKIPVDTAELINSLASGADGAFGPPSSDSYVAAIAGYDLGDYMRFAWTAPYAIHVEVGTSKMAGRHFVGVNAARFSEFVMKYAAQVKK